jgi:superfamily II DNA/RNA helicase
MDDFVTLGILPAFTDKLAERSITRPTAVQRLVIPPLLEGKSVIFRSATGTGKTFAYLIPALQRILSAPDTARSGPAFVICAPTFELCSQIKNEIDFLLTGENSAVKALLLIGSVNLSRQIDSLKKSKPLIVVGNPGRLLLLAKMGKLKFRNLVFLALDEADRLTANECRDEMAALANYIARESERLRKEVRCPEEMPIPLTVAACSATVSAATRESLLPLLGNAALLQTDEQEILRERIEHWAIFSEGRRKTQTLISFLAAAKPKKALVFTGRSYDAGKVIAALQRHAVAAAGLYSGMDKQERKNAVDRFRSGKTERKKVAVLVSSDLAARGLDIPGISHVIALDVSHNSETYIHRAGRTGRAGKRGIMVSIGDEVEMRRLAALEKKLGIVVHPKELYQGRVSAPEE